MIFVYQKPNQNTRKIETKNPIYNFSLNNDIQVKSKSREKILPKRANFFYHFHVETRCRIHLFSSKFESK